MNAFRILLVDDMRSMKMELERALSDIKVEFEIDYRCPEDRDREFGCELPKAEELESFDLAIVDLELFPPAMSIEYSAEDLRGGTEVLPYLRREAPWLPVVAISRLFHGSAQHFIAVGGSFGFDGHLPRQVLSSPLFNRRLWQGITERAALVRARATVGDEYRGPSSDAEVDAPRPVLDDLDLCYPGWKSCLGISFHFADRIVLDPLTGGYSGSRVYRAYVNRESSGLAQEGQWLVKLSKRPAKLLRELRSHIGAMRSGLEYARSVPPLWAAPVVVKGVGAIAYQFARKSEEAATYLGESEREAELATRLREILGDFYRRRSLVRNVYGRIVRQWSPSVTVLEKSLEKLPVGSVFDLVSAVVRQLEDGAWGRWIEYQQAWIHGDLHLANVLLGSRDVLIDFAWSDIGPIAVDAARLTVDLALRHEKFRGVTVPRWGEDHPAITALEGLAPLFRLEGEDITLFNDLCTLWVVAASEFSSVDEGAREWCRRVLGEAIGK